MKFWIFIFYVLFYKTTRGHYPEFMTTPSNKLDQFCLMSDSCIHDTIPVCGRLGEEVRTFLDICDLMEYACDHNQLYLHVDDMEGCPKAP